MSSRDLNFYEKLMGQELGEVYWHIAREVVSLAYIYDEYNYLFGPDSENRVDLINKAAASFFR